MDTINEVNSLSIANISMEATNDKVSNYSQETLKKTTQIASTMDELNDEK